jgi:hypothetical protein
MSGNLKNIFFNAFQFTFCNSCIESDFQKMRDEKLKFLNKFILCIMLFQTVLGSVFISFFLEHYNTNNVFKFHFISTYIDTLLYLILLFIGWNAKNIKLIRWIHYMTYYIKIFFTISSRNIMLYFLKVDNSIFSMFFLYENIFRLIWVLFYVHSFYENLFLNMLTIATLYLTVPFLSTYEENAKGMEEIKNYSFFMVSISFFCYLVERFLRITYYHTWSAGKKAEWLSNVLNNINSGFISLKGGNISFVNIFLLKYLKMLRTLSKLESQRHDQCVVPSHPERKESKI